MKSALYLMYKSINLVHDVCFLIIKTEKFLRIIEINRAFVIYRPLDLIVIKIKSLSFSFLVAGPQRRGMGSVTESWKATLNSTDVRSVLYKKKEYGA